MNKRKNGVIITSVVLSTIIAISSVGYSLNKKEPNNISTTIPSVTQEVEVDNNIINNSIEQILDNETLETYSYEELMLQLELNSSKFDNQTQNYLRNLVEIVYKNGKDLNSILNSISNFETSNFIMENIVKPLEKLNNIEIVSYDDYDRLNELDYRTCYDEDKQEIRICNETKDINYQRLLEELMHTNQTDILSYSENGNILDYADYLILGEGEANVISWALVYGKICNDSTCIMYSDDTYSDENIIYGTGYSYSAATKYYMYLVNLLGGDLIVDAINTHDASIITNALHEQYGIDGEDFYNKMKDVVVDLASNIDTERTHLLAPIENTYLSCLEQKLEKIDSEEELIEFLDLYRYTNIQYGFIHNEMNENSDMIDKTKDIIDKSIEDRLFERLEEYSVLEQLSDDSDIRRKIFDSLINPVRDSEKSIYPISLENTNISYDADLESVVLEYDGNSIVTNVNNRESKLYRQQLIDNGINIFDSYEAKML